MRVAQVYSHLNGLEFLMVHKPQLWQEIVQSIEAVDASVVLTKVSQEKTMVGKVLYSPSGLNSLFKNQFALNQWQEARVPYCVNEDLNTTRQIANIPDRNEQRAIIESNGFISYNTYNQVDFVKDRVAVEIQFGKYFSVQYDLHVKHTFIYGIGDIDVGIEIIPNHNLMSQMSTGVAWYENELMNIVREGRSNPSVPIVLIGIEP